MKKPATSVSGPERRKISHRLREAILTDGRTAYALGRDAEVDPGMIQRFLNGERGLKLDTADRLAMALYLRLVEVARFPGRGRTRKSTKIVDHGWASDNLVDPLDSSVVK